MGIGKTCVGGASRYFKVMTVEVGRMEESVEGRLAPPEMPSGSSSLDLRSSGGR
jgi:hypothetical protein